MKSVKQCDEVSREPQTAERTVIMPQQQLAEMSSGKDMVEAEVPADEDTRHLGHQDTCLQAGGGWEDSALIVGEGDIAMSDIPSMQAKNQQVSFIIYISCNIVMNHFL